MSPLPLSLDISITLEIRDGGVVLSAVNNGVEVARGCGTSVPEAVPALVSFFKDMQDATIDALYRGGLVSRPAVADKETLS